MLAADPATGWPLVGYLLLILLCVGVVIGIGYSLYRFGMWFMMTWYGERLGLNDSVDPATD